MKYAMFMLCLTLTVPAHAQMPKTLNYQGTLAIGSAAVPDGNYSVTFRLYTSSSGGSAVWTEAQLVSARNGVFNAILGKIVALPASFDKPYWLTLQVGADPELSPRLEITSVSYSMQSAVSDSTKKVADGSIDRAALADNAVTSAKMSASGSTSGQVPMSNGTTVTWGNTGLIDLTVVNSPIYSLASLSDTDAKIADVSSFMKSSATSVIEVEYDGRLSVGSMASGSGATFQIRIDNTPPILGSAVATVLPTEVGGFGISSHISGIFTGLSAGPHTVSIWVRQYYGTASNAYVNPGGWRAQWIIKEIK